MKSLSRLAWPLILAGLVLPAILQADPASLKIGDRPENFTLSANDGKEHSLFLKEAPKATAVLFIATLCPISNRYNERMVRYAKEYGEKGVRFLAVNSNDPEPMEEVVEHAKRNSYPFPVVKDPKNVLADKWGAQVTPEVYLFDQKGVLQYHGRIDDHTAEAKITAFDFKNALDAVLAGKKPEAAETKLYGCKIKRAGPP